MNESFQPIEDEIKRVLNRIDETRPGFLHSLGKGLSIDEIYKEFPGQLLPNGLIALYLNAGSVNNNKSYIPLDLLPGYTLIEIHRINKIKKLFAKLSNQFPESNNWKADFMPFLTDQTGCFFCVRCKENDQSVYIYFKDENAIQICKNMRSFFLMIDELYTKKAYFLDKDGDLNCDWDLEETIMAKYKC
ncbi:SMI1/KNR4 family protein [Acaryochloris marina NIES-2412]|uniref:SMI1/KNR4 family protein n=1 Tax=Acaryochloris marina TaxID=155978 RepID=UPI004059904E